MKISYEKTIEDLSENYEKYNENEFIVTPETYKVQDITLEIRKTDDLSKTVNEVKDHIILDQTQAEKRVRLFGLVFGEGYIVFLRIRMDRIDLTIQILKRDLTKITPAFQEKYKNLLESIGDSGKWDDFFRRNDLIEEFYQLFAKAKEKLYNSIEGIYDDVLKEEFANDLMMQLLIIWYLQEKGFLDGDKSFLVNKFRNLDELGFDNFYSLLQKLFKVMMSEPTNGPFNDSTELGQIIVTGPAPFINGNVIDAKIPNDTFYQEGETDFLQKTKPKKVSNVPILNLFESRDWTEGNIDEFVLGAIYEKIIALSKRKASGAYYTPEEITTYISNYCIGSYLLNEINNKTDKPFESLQDLFKSKNEDLIVELLKILKKIKIIDPAVGSAHFLESAIEYLLTLYRLIKERLKNSPLIDKLKITVINSSGEIEEISLNEIDDEKFNLYVKFFIILSRNIYGVDINKSALKVAKARLFLSLAKHFDVTKKHSIMFPNVHFNLRYGNSLVGFTRVDDLTPKRTGLDFFIAKGKTGEVIEKLKDIYGLEEYIESISSKIGLDINFCENIKDLNKYLSLEQLSVTEFKKILQFKEKLIRILIASLNSDSASKLNEFLNKITAYFNGKLDTLYAKVYARSIEMVKEAKTFHWIFEFPDVFINNNGFDVVIGNPPYFRITNAPKSEQKLIKNQGIFKTYHHGQGDIYYDFIVRSYELLRKEGYFTFIVSRYWLESAYANYLKKFFKEKINLLQVVDFRENIVFEGIGINNSIVSYKKELPNTSNQDFIVFIHQEDPNVLSQDRNPLELIEEVGYYNIENWDENENWTFVPKNEKDLFFKIKNTKSKIGDAFNSNQYNNSFYKPHKDYLTFKTFPNNIPKKYVRKYRKMGDINEFTVKEKNMNYVVVIHDKECAFHDSKLSDYFNEREIEEKDIIEIKDDSDKNIDKFDELIFIGYRIPRLKYNFVYDDQNIWVDNTYLISKKEDTSENYINSLKYLVGILNSDMMRYYIDTVGKKKDEEIEIGSTFILNLPIKIKKENLSKDEKGYIEKIKDCVDEIIKLEKKNKTITNEKKELNHLVYNLYNLKEAEIEIIENYIEHTKTLLFLES
ncbi:MAG: Eco57I restriction-modification methylase domain-containing protein [Candidatus Lokiarchaeota archaeon]